MLYGFRMRESNLCEIVNMKNDFTCNMNFLSFFFLPLHCLTPPPHPTPPRAFTTLLIVNPICFVTRTSMHSPQAEAGDELLNILT